MWIGEQETGIGSFPVTKVECYGESTSLDLRSRPEDTEIVQRVIDNT